MDNLHLATSHSIHNFYITRIAIVCQKANLGEVDGFSQEDPQNCQYGFESQWFYNHDVGSAGAVNDSVLKTSRNSFLAVTQTEAGFSKSGSVFSNQGVESVSLWLYQRTLPYNRWRAKKFISCYGQFELCLIVLNWQTRIWFWRCSLYKIRFCTDSEK